MPTLSQVPHWYYAIAVLISVYQAYRGFMFQLIFGVDTKAGQRRRVLLLCIADMFTYFVCAFTGFIALIMAYSSLWAARTPETTTLILFLTVYGIIGITGKLPDLLHKVKFP